MQPKVATIFGATGFLGRHVVRAFADAGYVVRAVSRSAKKGYFLRPYGDVGQVVPVQAHHDDPAGVDAVVRGADVVVYLPGLLYGRDRDFLRVHKDYPAQVAEAAARYHVRRFIHVSALGCDKSVSVYAQTKRAGELAVLQAYPNAVIIRPSIIFGNEDGFFGRFAQMARIMPALPLIGGGHTRFQPVHVDDVAKAITVAALRSRDPEGRVYELGGPRIYSFKELLDMMFSVTGLRRPLVPVPFAVASFKAMFLQLMPCPLLTVDQVRSLKTDNVVSTGSFGLSDLGVEPSALEAFLPSILARYRAGGPARKV